MTTTVGTPIEQTAATETEKPAVPDKRRALGRGLESLLPAGPRVVAGNAASAVAPAASIVLLEVQAQAARVAAGGGGVEIPLEQIDKNPYQTRHFSQGEQESDDLVAATLQELAVSIRTNGVIQPVVVRPGHDGRYILILGERRCLASKLAGREKIPAIIRRVSDQQAAEMTVVENLQRQDLNCMEQADAFAKLSRDFGLTQEQIGQRVGISRESVSNYMRLLKAAGDGDGVSAPGPSGLQRGARAAAIPRREPDWEDCRRGGAETSVRRTARGPVHPPVCSGREAGAAGAGALGGSECAGGADRAGAGAGSASAHPRPQGEGKDCDRVC